jgi:hypothetical protein
MKIGSMAGIAGQLVIKIGPMVEINRPFAAKNSPVASIS